MDISLVDVLWLTICAALLLLAQAGLLCPQLRAAEAPSNGERAAAVLGGLAAATLLYWALGFGLMFGASQGGWLGLSWFAPNIGAARPWPAALFVFQTMRCLVCCTIVAAALIGRSPAGSLPFAVAAVATLVYPLFGHWAWASERSGGGGSGWLAALGFVDLAGATTIHTLAGGVALAAALRARPRQADLPPAQTSPADDPWGEALGTLLLWAGWFGLIGGAALGASVGIPGALANGLLAGATGLLATRVAALLLRTPRIALAGGGSIAGLVAISAGAHAFSSAQAALVGAVAGLLLLPLDRLLARLRIADTHSLIAIHLGAGIWGALAVGLFGDLGRVDTGLGRIAQFGAQSAGVAVALAWACGMGYALLATLAGAAALPARLSSLRHPGPHEPAAPQSPDVPAAIDWLALLRQPLVLLIDADAAGREELVRALSRAGLRVIAADVEQGLRSAAEQAPEAIVLGALSPQDRATLEGQLAEAPDLASLPMIETHPGDAGTARTDRVLEALRVHLAAHKPDLEA
jgi:ammonium transporter, Amt family